MQSLVSSQKAVELSFETSIRQLCPPILRFWLQDDCYQSRETFLIGSYWLTTTPKPKEPVFSYHSGVLSFLPIAVEVVGPKTGPPVVWPHLRANDSNVG